MHACRSTLEDPTVYHLQQVCDEAKVPHPNIITESGRAIVAHHSLLVFNVLGVSDFGDEAVPAGPTPGMKQPLLDLMETLDGLSPANARESYHDAQTALDSTMTLFTSGHLSIEQRSIAENLYWTICVKLQKFVQSMDDVPEDLQDLDELLSDTYFCNFSLFQSIPDSWAIQQLFPIMPIHRLDERPTRYAVLGDITCDSDGKVDRFIDRKDVKHTLPLHVFDGKPYYLGVFLVGAYQEILGDLHNLLGDTHAVHVSLDENNAVVVNAVIKGDTVSEVLDYVEFDAEELIVKLRNDVEAAVRAGSLDYEQCGRLLQFYEDGLNGYTYLEEPAKTQRRRRQK